MNDLGKRLAASAVSLGAAVRIEAERAFVGVDGLAHLLPHSESVASLLG